MSKIPIHKIIKAEVMKRDGYCCRYCGADVGPFEIDHVVPESIGGPAEMWNLVTACEGCNRSKSDKTGIFPYPIGHFQKLTTSEITDYEIIKSLNKTITFPYVIRKWFFEKYSLIHSILVVFLPLIILAMLIYDYLDVYEYAGVAGIHFPFSPIWFLSISIVFYLFDKYFDYKFKLKEEMLDEIRNFLKSGG